MEIQLAITNQKMVTAAEEERFKDAATFRDRLEVLRLEHRCLDLQHKEGLRDSICHRLGKLHLYTNSDPKMLFKNPRNCATA
jgi:hypothetical protein